MPATPKLIENRKVKKVTEPTLNPIRTGGHRSLEILRELADARISALGAQRASRAVSDLSWQRAQSYAIQRDDFRTVWHAGHVTALLTNDVDVIAATQTGGVWLLKSINGPTALAGYTGTPLSDAWDAPDDSCLAWGPERTQVFVGTSAQAIFLLEFETALGGHLTLTQSTTLPVPFTKASAIVTLTNPRRIVVGTNTGIWWSPIPQPATNLSGYAWQEGQELPTAKVTGLAVGPGGSVATAKSGGRSLGIGLPPPGGGIYRGTFQGNALVFAESQIDGVDPALMQRTSLASCEDQPDRMYAVAAGADGQILAILSSRDGGATWRTRTAPDKAKAGLGGSTTTASLCRPVAPMSSWLDG